METIAHLREPDNGRITILFHAFEGPPSIVRIYGKGMYDRSLFPASNSMSYYVIGIAYEYGAPEYDDFLSSVQNTPTSADPKDINPEIVKRQPGSRSVIIVDIIEVMTVSPFSSPLENYCAQYLV